MLDRLYKIFSSLRLTVALLAVGFVLVFVGTLAQVKLGLYRAQSEYFRGFFVYWSPEWSDARLPVFPAGYTVGGLLLINLMLAHFRYYQPGRKKWGIVLIHTGVVLLLVGQLLTDVLSRETMLHLRQGETKNYSEASSEFEMTIVDTSDPVIDHVVAIPSSRLRAGGEIAHSEVPFTLRVVTHYSNSALSEKPAPGYEPVRVTNHPGLDVWWRAMPHETVMGRRDMPSAIVEVMGRGGSLGTYFISSYLVQPQRILYEGKMYLAEMRLRRFYKPYSIQLIEFRHDRYPGTEIPKNFSSRVRLVNPSRNEDREVLIYMNNPLRYDGLTFYQASFDKDDQGTVLQVVRNPSWLTPYFACVLVALGMLIQFGGHLTGFARKRKDA